MTILSEFYNSIDNYNKNGYGSNTQKTSDKHEQFVKNILKEKFDAKEIRPEVFKKILHDNNKKIKSNPKKKSDLIVYCPECIKITNSDTIDLHIRRKKNFIVHQPAGAQDYPDLIMGTYEKDKILLTYIECKQRKPTFNNNPPKGNFNCIYICGNDLYSGIVLTNRKIQRKINSYKNDLKMLCLKYTDNNIRFVPYNKIECNWDNMGPTYKIDTEFNEINLDNCFNRHIS